MCVYVCVCVSWEGRDIVIILDDVKIINKKFIKVICDFHLCLFDNWMFTTGWFNVVTCCSIAQYSHVLLNLLSKVKVEIVGSNPIGVSVSQ